MVQTELRPGYDAGIMTPYMPTDDKCLRFFYKFLGSGMASLEVLIISEDLVQTSLFKTTGSNSFQWLVGYVFLPSDVNMVKIVGTRGESGSSGLELDDIEIALCSSFEGKFLLSNPYLLLFINEDKFSQRGNAWSSITARIIWAQKTTRLLGRYAQSGSLKWSDMDRKTVSIS